MHSSAFRKMRENIFDGVTHAGTGRMCAISGKIAVPGMPDPNVFHPSHSIKIGNAPFLSWKTAPFLV